MRKHHQLDVRRIAVDTAEMIQQVIDLIRREREAQRSIRLFERSATMTQQVDRRQRPRPEMRKQPRRVGKRREHRFGHAVRYVGF